MKGIITILLALCLLAAVAIWYLSEPPPPPTVVVPRPAPVKLPPAPPAPPKVTELPPPAPPAPTPRIEPGPIKAPPPKPVPIPASYAATIEASPEKMEAEELARNLRDFGHRFGGNPTGTNAEIAKTLMGGNSAKATYLPSGLQRLNGNGEIVDMWGTPYFFHSNSSTETEVRSAGPDKVLHTKDDIVTK